MNRLIKAFADGSVLEFDRGSFDDWCVYLTENGKRRAPRDIEYFTALKNLSQKFGRERIYADFARIFERTTAMVDPAVLEEIATIAATYESHSPVMEKLFALLYAGMIAEENKAGAILKKRVKRLGMHQLLIDNLSPSDASTFSSGKHWRELERECSQRGF